MIKEYKKKKQNRCHKNVNCCRYFFYYCDFTIIITQQVRYYFFCISRLPASAYVIKRPIDLYWYLYDVHPYRRNTSTWKEYK